MRYLAFLACVLAVGSPAAVQFKLTADPARPEIVAKIDAKLPLGEVAPEEGVKILHVSLVDEKTGQEGPPLFGAYESRKDELIFRPRHPLLPGNNYRARLVTEKQTADYRVPAKKAGPPAVVKEAFPALDALPANNLRFTIVFSKPMRGGKEIFDQIRLLDPDGKEVHDPWLHDELWGDDDCRLLLYIHPGRIKWGVLLRMLFGPVLVPDREYTLVLSADMLDIDGQRLGKEYRKKFRTTAEDRVRIELKDWKVRAPEAGSKLPLTFEFGKALDHNAVKYHLTVKDAKGQPVEGAFTMGDGQKSCRFVPAQLWTRDEYRVIVGEHLEDLAGNTPLRPFDFDLTSKAPPPQNLTLSFRPTVK